MAQHDYFLSDQPGAGFRQDINNALAAIVSNNSGPNEPNPTYAYQPWADTTTGLLKQRNAANNGWIVLGTLAEDYLGLLSRSGGTMTGALTLSGNPTTTNMAANKGYVDSEIAKINSVPTGSVLYVAQNTAPAGYLKANGAQVSRTTYADLFAAIGATYGAGNGSTTFTLPDLRGEFIRSWDDGRGIDPGRSFGTAQADAFASHTHGYQVSAATFAANNGSNVTDTLRGTASTSTGATGGTETRPRNIAMLAIIKF